MLSGSNQNHIGVGDRGRGGEGFGAQPCLVGRPMAAFWGPQVGGANCLRRCALTSLRPCQMDRVRKRFYYTAQPA